MSIHNAIKLVKDLDTDERLRKAIYTCETVKQTYRCLADYGYQFSPEEMQEAINFLHVQCQTLEEAQEVMHKAEYIRFLLHINS